MCMNKNRKIRVNISIDRKMLEKAKMKLSLFGGKLSTLFNVYLKDFVESMDKNEFSDQRAMQKKIEELEKRIGNLESNEKGK